MVNLHYRAHIESTYGIPTRRLHTKPVGAQFIVNLTVSQTVRRRLIGPVTRWPIMKVNEQDR